ncbi:hypothetical protein QJU73_10785 [Pasteurella atlantica]|uniref:Uncharacterized protein n=1 Tax=Pasteurella atlantica TaxID=2827233 RepID=A0AAW8CRK4_9PAST|nr:hypothetical protein [Pasteurella atlantica]MDP8040567.1 hypothetical protein [Pasteurella atlantica]MDP8042694.1 hypothetical protein [Pasteurella atlantica]MDP8044785.1 hypothetical protein [Pasteurella atlantica]MDP8046882.1 hypothetical protein [Pasteurella atlantica]MDP8062729.1 hypothetical protein [Pasteurella atlantica]
MKDYIGKSVVFGIRPEAIEAVESGGIEGDITVVEQMGNEEYIYFNIGTTQWICRMNVDGEKNLRRAGCCEFIFNTAKCHIFDKETEQNVSL